MQGNMLHKLDGVMCIYIIDSCNDVSDCYARCMCDYTFDFVFKHQETINQKYKIILVDPRKENSTIISEGIIANNTNHATKHGWD